VADDYPDRIERVVRDSAVNAYAGRLKVVRAGLGGDAPLIGAGTRAPRRPALNPPPRSDALDVLTMSRPVPRTVPVRTPVPLRRRRAGSRSPRASRRSSTREIARRPSSCSSARRSDFPTR
jgi:hypothetical protein